MFRGDSGRFGRRGAAVVNDFIETGTDLDILASILLKYAPVQRIVAEKCGGISPVTIHIARVHGTLFQI